MKVKHTMWNEGEIAFQLWILRFWVSFNYYYFFLSLLFLEYFKVLQIIDPKKRKDSFQRLRNFPELDFCTAGTLYYVFQAILQLDLQEYLYWQILNWENSAQVQKIWKLHTCRLWAVTFCLIWILNRKNKIIKISFRLQYKSLEKAPFTTSM